MAAAQIIGNGRAANGRSANNRQRQMAANWEDESALMEHHKSKEELEEELTSSSKSTMHYGVSKRQELTGIVSFSLI
jgi:hypothetical protein